jgi:hypothetical protein
MTESSQISKPETLNVTYFDELAQGSKYHRAECKGNTLEITPIPENDPKRIKFKEIGTEAEREAAIEGHQVIPHDWLPGIVIW